MGLFGSHTYSISYLRLFCNLHFLQAANVELFFLQKMDDNAILGIIFFLNFSHYLRQSLPQSSALSSQCSEQAPEKPFELRLRDSECFVYRKMSRSALAVLYVFKQVRVLCLKGHWIPKVYSRKYLRIGMDRSWNITGIALLIASEKMQFHGKVLRRSFGSPFRALWQLEATTATVKQQDAQTVHYAQCTIYTLCMYVNMRWHAGICIKKVAPPLAIPVTRVSMGGG